MVMVHSYFPPLRLGWPAFINIHLPIITRFISLGKDAIINDVLQKLDEHYAVVMMFDALSKELYSLKQGSGKNVAEFGVHLSQQVQIFQSEYPGRIQLEHLEDMKCDYLCKGLNP